MSQFNTTLHSTFLDTYHTVSRRLEDLLSGKSGDSPYEDLIRIESFLDSLPLATDEYGLAQNRIRNARRYFQAREIGAARYELRLQNWTNPRFAWNAGSHTFRQETSTVLWKISPSS